MFSAATKSAHGPATEINYIESVFSTYLYTGTGASQTITNNIDLSGKGGLTWIKSRSDATGHRLTDTVRGATKSLASETNAAEVTESTGLTAFGSTGFTIGADADYNTSAATYCSWTFRKQPKFFDVVTYTGTGSAQNINHNLGSVPGMIIIKSTTNARNWAVYHKDVGNTTSLYLNGTGVPFAADIAYWNNTSPTSSNFTVNTWTANNESGQTYVAYLFAHDAGGFGTTGTDNVISCGSYTTDASGNATINLGYEPQYVLIKSSTASDYWQCLDVMRGFNVNGTDARLFPNDSLAEYTAVNIGYPTATGFYIDAQTVSTTFIYMAIRRPMKVPTDATTVFSPTYVSSVSAGTKSTTGFPIDMQLNSYLNGTSSNQAAMTRLIRISTNSTASGIGLVTSSTASESSLSYSLAWDNTGFQQFGAYAGAPGGFWNFSRRPGFFDVVCYTGAGSATTQAHNLGVAPELMIVKERSATNAWWIYHSATGNTNYSVLNTTAIPVASSQAWNNTTPTASVFSIGTGTPVNSSGNTFVAYLFATCAGVSKVGTYTGNGTTQAIACGFTGGARFVLIKRTDAVGGWYVYDTARGMTTLTDPYLLLNSTAAQSATLGSVTTTAGGFTVNATILAAINTSGASYIFLAIS